MSEFLIGVFFGFVMSVLFTILCVDTSAESYRRAEAACVTLNSMVKSFDYTTATCENTAVIVYRQKQGL